MDHNLNPVTLSYKDILLTKLYHAVAASVLSQLLILLLYVFVANINLFHPIEWMTSTFQTFMYIGTWLFVLLFISIIFAQCIICAKDYIFMSSYCSTRFQQLLHIFSLHNFILLTLHILVGGVIVWQTLSIVDGDYKELIRVEGIRYYLVSDTFFLILNGLFTGLYFFLKVYISNINLVFPVVQQRKFLHFRSHVVLLFKESFILSIWPTLYFAAIFYMWGNYFEIRFSSLLSINKIINQGNILIYFYSWLFATLYIFNMNLIRFFFYLYLTEAVEFPLTKDNPSILTLQEAIVLNNPPIVQHLACLDLFLLSRWSPERRQVLFTLSQPGGHPHNWNGLVESLLKLFADYTDQLKKSTEHPVLQETVKKQNITDVLSPIDKSCPGSIIAGPRFRNLRNMSIGNDSIDIVTVSQTTPENTDLKSMQEAIKNKFSKLLNFVKIILGINYVFGELPQANIQKSLGEGQLIIWASQGISELLAASMTEDKYGVAQKDLPVILTSLVHLKQNLDKLNKVTALSKKIASLDDFNYKMKNALSAAVKRSLFQICLNFGEFLQDFSLNKDVMQYLYFNVLVKN